ncbi:MAG TPA: hypothetical protein VMQ62_11360 [Dongiaceae bacterium]|nr:hypothetical protein [Dongiaceae bacterium]
MLEPAARATAPAARAGLATAPVPTARVMRSLKPEDRDAVLDLVARVWGPEQRRLHAHLWEWKHARDGRASGPGHLSRVVEQHGRVIGHAGAIPARFLLDGHPIDGAFCLDTLVDPGERGAGVALMRDQFASGMLLIGAGNRRSEILYERLSGRKRLLVRDARRLSLVIDPAPWLERRGVPRALAAVARLAHRGARALRRRSPGPLPAGLAIEAVRRFPAEVDALADAFAGRFRRQTRRDRDWLDWRFVQAPFRYEILLLRDHGRLAGYAVHRATRLHGRPVTLLVEMIAIGDPRRHYDRLATRVEAEAAAAGSAEIHALDPGDALLVETLRRRGWFRRREPHHLLAYLAGPAGEAADFTDPGAWYLGLGDADFEFIFFNQGAPDAGNAGATSGDLQAP